MALNAHTRKKHRHHHHRHHQQQQQTATNNFVLDEKRIIKLATMMLDCEVAAVVAVAVVAMFFSSLSLLVHRSAGNGWFICRKHAKKHAHTHTVIKIQN